MKTKVGLTGLGLVLLLLLASLPASAVPLENVSLKMYDPDGNLLSCPQNDTPINMVLEFEINTASPLPMTYQIRLSPQIFEGTYFDFSNAAIDQITRDDLTDGNPAIDVTSEASVIAPGTLTCPGSVDYCILVEEGNEDMPGNQKWVVRITNVVTPTEITNYTISIGVLNQQGSVQYGEYTIQLEVCPAPEIIIPPEPKVIPCSCAVLEDGSLDCGCTYRYFPEADEWYKATPSACFKEIAPYKEGLVFLGWKKFVNGELVDYIDVPEATEVPSGVCERYDNTLDTSYSDDFTDGTEEWSADNQWGYGEPLRLLNESITGCLRTQVDKDYVWGLGILDMYHDYNYSNTPLQGNLTKTFEFNCGYKGTVDVSFYYAGFLEDGDEVIIEGWDGVQWVKIGRLTSANNTCSPVLWSGSFDMNTSQLWGSTKIRFRFVSDNDGNTHVGMYIYSVSIVADTNCQECAEYVPLYYVSPCECLEDYTEIPLNGVVNVTVEAVYDDPTNGGTYVTTSSLDIIFDNTQPTITKTSEDDTNFYFSVVDTLTGVEANADDEPIKVVAGEDRYSFEHWEKDLISDIYTYHIYDPAKETKSAAIFFDRIELGVYELLEVLGGCVDCEIFETGIDEGCYERWYGGWGYPWDLKCTHSAWVRVPLQACEDLCYDYDCQGCSQQVGCEDCAFIVYQDNRLSVEWGIHVDSIVYGTGIAVFLDGVDITDQVTITTDGKNATIAVPKSLITDTSELVIYATDKVGNANKAVYQLSVSGGETGPIEEPWQAYDDNGDGAINDNELIDAIMAWLNNQLSDTELLNVIMKWLE